MLPKNCASPKENTPPSPAESQYPEEDAGLTTPQAIRRPALPVAPVTAVAVGELATYWSGAAPSGMLLKLSARAWTITAAAPGRNGPGTGSRAGVNAARAVPAAVTDIDAVS